MTETDINKFLSASAELGKNFDLIQGAGGNTSYKSGDSLFIKASGFKLKNSLEKNIFVELNYKKLNKALIEKKNDPLKNTWQSKKTLKPSIETSMHSILPFKYIFHVHCLNSISWLVRKNFESEFKKIFQSLDYKIVKYTKPGVTLTLEIQKLINEGSPSILFLKNHGLVVGSNNIDQAMEKIILVSNKLDQTTVKSKNNLQINNKLLEIISLNTPYRITKYKEANKLAFNNKHIEIALKGCLYPDQVVFLGKYIYAVNNHNELQLLLKRFKNNKFLPTIIVPKGGILVPRNITEEAEEMIQALQIIISKIPENEEINFLNDEQMNELLNWDAESYRVSLSENKA